jgi:hypothetical protein
MDEELILANSKTSSLNEMLTTFDTSSMCVISRVGNRYFEKLFSITIPIPTFFYFRLSANNAKKSIDITTNDDLAIIILEKHTNFQKCMTLCSI